MLIARQFIGLTFIGLLLVAGVSNARESRDWLPAWQASDNRSAIIDFVERTTTPGTSDYIRPAERIAVFDNDGTLWSEQPIYFQFYYALDRVKAMAPAHPEWREQMPFKAALEGDMEAIQATGRQGLAEIVMATHTGNTQDEFVRSVGTWLATARHPQTGKLFTEMVYQPMLDVLRYLRANGYKTYIVSGGGIEFLRVFAEQVYGVPPEQVIGSSFVTTYDVIDGKPVLQRKPKFLFLNDASVKPVSIARTIGRRPVMAFGNSDGDFQMLEWTTAGDGPRLGVYIHHDDGKREWSYDRDSAIGRLDKGLDEASRRGWLVVSMQQDWNSIFPPD